LWVSPLILIPPDSRTLHYDYSTQALPLSQEKGLRECLSRATHQHLLAGRLCVIPYEGMKFLLTWTTSSLQTPLPQAKIKHGPSVESVFTWSSSSTGNV